MKTSVIYQEILLEDMARGIAQGEAQGIAQGEAQGLDKGKAKATRQIAMNMLSDNVTPDLVAKFTGLTLKQVQKLQQLVAKQSQSLESSRVAKVKRSSKPR